MSAADQCPVTKRPHERRDLECLGDGMGWGDYRCLHCGGWGYADRDDRYGGPVGVFRLLDIYGQFSRRQAPSSPGGRLGPRDVRCGDKWLSWHSQAQGI
jgi:hypothetical protein